MPSPAAAVPDRPTRSRMTAARQAGSNMFRSLRVRNYRLYFSGQLASICGTWMQTIAQALLVLDLSDDNGLAAGAVVAIQFTPMLLFGAMAGLVVDRFDKRRLMTITQALLGLSALLLGVLALSGVIELWMVYLIVLGNGLVTTIDMPLRQAFVSEMVGEEDLPNAVALNSAVMNSARIIGPALAAAVLYFVDEGVCFLVNAVSYVAVISSLALMRQEDLHRPERAVRAPGQVREGIRYTWSQRQVRYTVLLVGVFGAVAFNFNVTLPLMARRVFENESAFSAMTVAMGIGSLAGALTAASRKVPKVDHLLVACGGFAVLNLLAAASPTLVLMMAALTLMGFCSITFLSTANALVQMSAAPSMRGRVMALYSMVLLGGTPAGNVVAGWIANTAGARWGLGFGGVAAAVGLLALGRRLRQAVPEPVVREVTPASPEPALADAVAAAAN